QTWMLWWALDGNLGIPTIEDTSNLKVNTFDNFYRGDSPAPGVVWAPSVDLALGYPNSFIDLHEEAYNNAIALGHSGYGNAGTYPYEPRNPRDPEWINVQEESTTAAYALVRFGFDDLAMPVDGNFGLRVVKTESTATGNMVYPTGTFAGAYFNPQHNPAKPDEVASVPLAYENSYTDVLPSFNLRVSLRDNLVWRIALSQAIARPDFTQLKAYQELSANLRDGITPGEGVVPEPTDYVLTSSSWNNPNLKPLDANLFDTSLGWYFNDRGGMAHMNLFYKYIVGIIRNQSVVEIHNG